jgi:hypothetical protein
MRAARPMLLACALLSTACADAIVFGTRTSLGVRARPTQDSQTELTLGYNRQEIAIFPRKIGATIAGEDGKEEPHAYSVFAWFRFTNRWLPFGGAAAPATRGGLCLRQEFATGRAAEEVAKSMQTLEPTPDTLCSGPRERDK